MTEWTQNYVAFAGQTLLARGSCSQVVQAAKAAFDDGNQERIVLFDETEGRPVDVDLSGAGEEVLARVARHPVLGVATNGDAAPVVRRRGRPKLGVVSREVSLLPRHWSWLGAQRGGASAALRRLVDAARKASSASDAARQALDAAHHFLWDMAGNLPGFEEVSRALFAGRFASIPPLVAAWPRDVRDQAQRMVERARHATEAAELG